MPLLETDALTIRSTFDSLPDEAKPLASDWLRRYKDQQDEFGLPLFPSEVETQQADESAFVSMFDDVKQVDPGNGIYDQAERLKSGEGDRLRQREAGMRFLAKHYRDEEKVRRDFPLYRDDYAMQNGGKRDMGDGEFYSFVSQQVKRQQGQKLVRSRSLDAGFRAAIEGMGSLEKLAAVKSQAATNADSEVDAGAFLEAYGETQKVMSKHAAFIRETVQAVSAEMDGGDVDLEPLKERLLDMPGTERRIVLAALRMEADKAGEKVKGEKGGKFDLFAGKFLQQTGEAAFRIAANAATDARQYETFVNLVPETGSARFSGTAIKTPEDARKYVRESIAQDIFSRAASAGAGPGGVGAFPPMDSRNEITLDETAQRLIQDAKEREMKRLRVANEIRSIGEAADPIPNVFASTIGTSGAALALMAGTRGLAAPALASAYTNVEFNDLGLKYPQMSTADKTQIAAISGAAQAALDYVGVKALVKLPGIKSLIAQPLTKQLAGRALARGAMSFGLENVVEAGQDIATAALMQALKSYVPGFDWEAEQREFWKGRADVAIGLLPLTLLGIVAASVNEYRGAKNLLSWNDQLGAAGVVETDRVAVIEAAQSGDMGKAQSLLMEAWGRRNPEVAAEYQDAMSQRQTDMSRATAELERLGAIPTLRRDGEGWTVTSNGTSTKFATWEEARDVATAAMGDMERAQTELVASLSDSFMASTPGFLKGESVEFNTDAKGESLVDRVNAGAMTPEQAMEAAVAGGVIKGVTMQEARAIAAEVFGGQNASERAMQFRQDVEKIAVLGRNTVQNGQSRSIVNAAGNERSFLTVVEEVVEGRWKGGLERRAFTKDMGIRWVQLAEAATGETFLEGSTWEEIAASSETAPRALTEAISRIIVADVLGRMKDGKRIGPGTVSSGLNLNDREQSALAAILDAFRKLFRALLETASKLAKARQEGKLGGEYDALFDALTGGSSQLEHDAGATKEADAIASEAVDTSGYSPETPGPNGETFSISSKELRSKIDSSPDLTTLGELGITEGFHANHGEEFIPDFAPRASKQGRKGQYAGFYLGPALDEVRQYGQNVTTFPLNPNMPVKILRRPGQVERITPEMIKEWRDEGVGVVVGPAIISSRIEIATLSPSVLSGETFSLRVTPAQDAEYMAAVQAGDMEKAQRMVDEAANDAADTLEQHNALVEAAYLNAIRHGNLVEAKRMVDAASLMSNGFTATRRDDFTVARLNKAQLREVMEIASNQTSLIVTPAALYEDSEPIILARNGKPDSLRDGFWRVAQMVKGGYDGNIPVIEMTGPEALEFSDSIDDSGIDVRQEYVTVYDAAKVEIADPSGGVLTLEQRFPYASLSDIQLPTVLRDDAGNVIPLSQRFNPADDRITYSLRPGDFSARMAAKFSPFQAKPELRLAITQVAKERALRLGAEWIAKGDVIRSAKDIGKEARMREALAYEARMNEYLDGLSENARQTLEFEPSALEDDPLVSAMLDFGKLMSFTTAKKSGKVEAKSGDYDGQPWLPPAWFSKGAGIMPDQMAQAMFDAGMLPDAYTGTLWSELEKRIEATRKDKAAHREAVQAYKAAEKYARDASRAEADQWAENAKKQAGSPKAQRDMLKAALRTLDGILAAAPPEVRARVGGYVKLAGLATDEAMLAEIERRIDKLNVELEKYLKKQAVAEISKLFKKARPDMEAGKKGKGKDADMHALFAAAEAAADMDALAVAGRLADLDARIASGELTSEQEALAMTERGIVELVGDLKNADSGRAFSALDTLRDIYGGAWLKWKIAEIERKERRAGLRQDFIEATGKAGVRTERTKADKVNESLFGKGKAWLLNLSSMREVLAYAFGLDNERVTSLVDAERTASNTYEDANQRLGDEIEGLFTAMAGTRTKGERLRWNLSQRTIKTGKGELSQLEAIQALLMWRQEDGRRHMEGTRDESGKVTSSWSYDQAWIDEIEAALTPEARQVMSFIMGKYAAEWATLNPLYRARYGVNMPHHDAYAPITVTPVQTKAGEVVDPVTGSAVSGGSILTPGSLRTRSRNAIAEPDFRDALQTMILHSRQMEYWKAYYDLAVEMNAVLGNREVMNSVHAKGGKEAANALRQWIDVIGQGGFRDASLRLALFQAGSKLQGRAAGVALLGRMSTILVQSTQLAAASVKMPVTSYLVRLAKLMTGGLGWRDAMRSDFIQRRFKTAPPIVRQAMDSLASAKPNEIQQLSRFFGNVLSGADAFFTSGTYAILLDYHREQGRAAGLTGAELDAYAHTEAERATEQVAQPLRTANRSLAELSNTGPLGKIGWAFASEARQKVALAAHAALNAKNDPVTAAKSAFLTFAIGGLFSQVLKNLLREAKGDDDREMWSLGRLGYAMTIAPLASAIPFGSAIAGDSNMLSNIQRAIQTLGNEEVDFRDVDAMLSAAGLFNDTAASLAQLSHLGLDLGKILANAAD